MFDNNVSFIQSGIALKHGCNAANALTTLRVPVVLNLAGYVIGALVLSPISDRIGRRNMLLFNRCRAARSGDGASARCRRDP